MPALAIGTNSRMMLVKDQTKLGKIEANQVSKTE